MVEDDPLFKVRESVVVIAGAGGGLGGDTARTLHGRGALLILFDIDEPRLRAVEADCQGALAEVTDITDDAQVRTIIAKGMEKFGQIDGAVNAAGLLPMGRLAEPRDLMGTILLLLADGGAFITGQTIYVDGGRTLV